jgi:CRISPR-associated protein Csb2
LASCGPEGGADEAPPILRAHGDKPHAAFVPLSFIGDPAHGAAARHADGRTLGIGILLPHEDRVGDLLLQRAAVVERLVRFLNAGGVVRVTGVGAVRLVRVDGEPNRATLHDACLRRPSRFWTTATPVVASSYLRRRSRAGRADHRALVDQIARDCAHVGLPRPRYVERRVPRLPGAPLRALTGGLRPGWRRPAEGPHLHVDLEFDRAVVGPVLLGRARHFELGLCLPYGG